MAVFIWSDLCKKKRKKNPTYYDSKYNREEFGTMKRYGNGDLYNEVELIRYLNLRALAQMEKEKNKLTFRDYLSALHAFSRSAGRIAHLMEMQEKIFPEREKVNGLLREMNSMLLELDESIASKIESCKTQELEVPRELEQYQAERLQQLLENEI